MKIINKIIALSVLIPTFVVSGLSAVLPTIASADTIPTSTVTITKYINGVPATVANASSTPFLFSATWNATNLGSGSGQFSLAPEGSYSAMTAEMNNGASYSVQELNQNGTSVATSCTAGGPRYVLSGYTTGNSLAEAAAGTPSLTIPSFTSLSQNKYVIVWNRDCTLPIIPGTVRVNIAKYIQGAPATAVSASSTPFLMSATWNASNIGSGTGQYSLVPGGSAPYQSATIALNSGASYATNELMANGSNATTTCSSGQRYVLQGYTTGNSWSEAQNGTLTMTFPSFANLTQDKYVIVWNRDCNLSQTGTSQVHILKYVNGIQATASSTNSFLFPMMATWNATNLNNGVTTSAQYSLGNFHGGASNMYGADTALMNNGYSYTTFEETGGQSPILSQGSACIDGRYRLEGYRTSPVSFAQANLAPLTTTAPVFNGVSGDQYVIIYNTLCGNATNTIPLSVTVTPIKTTGIADNTYENGWRYVFHVTAPSNETNLSMKFDNWFGAIAGTFMPVSGNMRISSAQATNGPVLITAPNTYSAPLNLVGDMDSVTPGRQVDVVVEVKIPFGTINTSYTTNFGVQTLP